MPLRTRNVQPMQPYRPGIMIYQGKHGNSYYHVPTEAHLHAAALDLLKLMYEGGWYDGLKPDDREEEGDWIPKHPGMEPEEIEKLPEGPIREAARKAWKAWKGHHASRDACTEEWNAIQAAVEHKDGRAAWQILRERSHGEYDSVDVESLDGEDLKLLPRPKKPRHGERWTDGEGQRWVFDGKKKGRNLGWIKGDHAHWEGIYAAHETGEMSPEITQYDKHWVVYKAWSNIYRAFSDGQTAGEVEGFPVSTKDFKEGIEDLVEFAKHPQQNMQIVTDQEEALKTGVVVFQGYRVREKFTCTVRRDASMKSNMDYEDSEDRRRRREAKKKAAKKKATKKKATKKKATKKKVKKKTG